jgi:hypothetical protein
MHPLSLLPALLPLTSVFLSTLLSAPAPAWAGSQKIGQNCSTADSKLLEGTYAFYDDCDTHAYCNDTTKLCANKECRHDIFPFGYNTSEHLPPLCDHGEFCPDEQSFCIAQLSVGEQCQLNRDGACGVRTGVDVVDSPASSCRPMCAAGQLGTACGHDWPRAQLERLGLPERLLHVRSQFHIHSFNHPSDPGYASRYANVTAGQDCVVENTAYIAYEPDGSQYIDIVSRGNCIGGLYCDAQSHKCLATKALGQACEADKECSTYNCGAGGKCGADPHLPVHVASWVFAIVAIAIAAAIGGTLFALFSVHRRERDAERERRTQYWREQHAFRQNILQMQDSVRESALGAGGESQRSTYFEENSPFAGGAKPSGLRNETYSEDGQSDDGSHMYDAQRNNRF